MTISQETRGADIEVTASNRLTTKASSLGAMAAAVFRETTRAAKTSAELAAWSTLARRALGLSLMLLATEASAALSHDNHVGTRVTVTDDLNATVTYGAPGFPGLPRVITVRDGMTTSGNVLRKREGRYDDGKGNLTSLLSSIDGASSAETTLEWYPNGNLKAVTSPPNEVNARYRIDYEYGAAGAETWPTRIFDSFGYASTAEYAPEYGQATSTTDLNGQTTTRQTKTTARVVTLGVGMTASGAQEYDVMGRVVAQGGSDLSNARVFDRDDAIVLAPFHSMHLRAGWIAAPRFLRIVSTSPSGSPASQRW